MFVVAMVIIMAMVDSVHSTSNLSLGNMKDVWFQQCLEFIEIEAVETVSDNFNSSDYDHVKSIQLHEGLHETELDIIKSCDIQSVVVISDGHFEFTNSVIKVLTNSPVPIVHYDLQQEQGHYVLEKIINTSYLDLGMTHFFLLVSKPDDVFKSAEIVFQKQERGKTAAMPHRTRWFIFWNSNDGNQSVVESLQESLFDNVCLISLRYNASADGLNLESVSTLMWRSGRKRQFQKLSLNQVRTSAKCLVFPNVKYGLNGRKLHALAKVFFSDSYLKMTKNTIGKEVTYSGAYYDIMDVLAKDLNFSLDISLNNNISWKDYRTEIWMGNFDLGMTLWRVNIQHPRAMATTFPVEFHPMVGLYQLPDTGTDLSDFHAYYPLPGVALVYLLLAILATSLIYVFLKETETEVQSEPLSNNERTSLYFPRRYITVVWEFMVSCLNQSTSLRPLGMPARIQLWTWCMTIVVLYALYTGYLTREKIKPDEDLPFRTFDEMISRGDYTWGIANSDGLEETFRNSSDDMMQKLDEGFLYIDLDQSRDDFVKEMVSRLKEKFVFIFNEGFINSVINETGRSDLRVIKEILFQYNGGYVLPFYSELTDILSAEIKDLHQTGIFKKILQNYLLYPNSKDVDPLAARDDTSKHLVDLLPLVVLVAGPMMSAVLALWIEISVAYFMMWRRRRKGKETVSQENTVSNDDIII